MKLFYLTQRTAIDLDNVVVITSTMSGKDGKPQRVAITLTNNSTYELDEKQTATFVKETRFGSTPTVK